MSMSTFREAEFARIEKLARQRADEAPPVPPTRRELVRSLLSGSAAPGA